jgi:zinc-finger of acetyl-transferase ESCO
LSQSYFLTATSEIWAMDKFVDSFSRGLKKTKIHPTKAKKSGTLQGTQHQMFLDLGQKLFGKSKECKNCGMYFVIGDVDDERRHNQICAKVFMSQERVFLIK